MFTYNLSFRNMIACYDKFLTTYKLPERAKDYNMENAFDIRIERETFILRAGNIMQLYVRIIVLIHDHCKKTNLQASIDQTNACDIVRWLSQCINWLTFFEINSFRLKWHKINESIREGFALKFIPSGQEKKRAERFKDQSVSVTFRRHKPYLEKFAQQMSTGSSNKFRYKERAFF